MVKLFSFCSGLVVVLFFLSACTFSTELDSSNVSSQNLSSEGSYQNPVSLRTSNTTNSSAVSPSSAPEQVSSEADTTVTWYFTGTAWQVHGSSPDCPDPLVLDTPVDLSLATSVLYPGQLRGGNYKAHGGFRFDHSQNSAIKVIAPLDGNVVEGSRYIEDGTVQYLFDVINSCGIMYRFDHLLTLSPAFQKIADTFPEPVKDDSRTTYLSHPVKVKQGDVIATAVGMNGNTFVDWGVYDLRQRNAASQDPSWLQKQDSSYLAPYAVCWFDLLSAQDSQRVWALPAGDETSGDTSDFCTKK